MENGTMKKLLAFLTVAIAFASAPATAQQAQAPGYRDPGTSTLLSLAVPGGGQLYSGETGRGLALLGGGLGGLILGTAMTTNSIGGSCDYDALTCSDDTNYVPMAVGYLAFFGTWIYGIIDADDSANRSNVKRGLAQVLAGTVAPVVSTSSDGTRMGLSIRF
jgi:hypothetical protein